MWNIAIAISGVLLGLYLIVFRRSYVQRLFKKQIGSDPYKEDVPLYLQKVQEIGQEKTARRIIGFMICIFGVILILMHLPAFFPGTAKYISIILRFSLFSFFSAIFSVIVEFMIMERILFRKFIKNKHWKNTSASYIGWTRTSQKEKPESNFDDLHFISLRRQFRIYATIYFLLFFSMFMFLFNTLFVLTGG